MDPSQVKTNVGGTLGGIGAKDDGKGNGGSGASASKNGGSGGDSSGKSQASKPKDQIPTSILENASTPSEQPPQSPSVTNKKIAKAVEQTSKKRKVGGGTSVGGEVASPRKSLKSSGSHVAGGSARSQLSAKPSVVAHPNRAIVDVSSTVQTLSEDLTNSTTSKESIVSTPSATNLPSIKLQAQMHVDQRSNAARVSSTTASTCSLTIRSDGEVLWEDFFIGRATSIGACSSFFAVGTLSGEVYVYRTEENSSWGENKSGKAIRAMPCLAVGGGGIAGVKLYEFTGTDGAAEVRLMCVTAFGDISVWDLNRRKRIGKGAKNVLGAMDVMVRSGVEGGSDGGEDLPKLQRAFLEPGTQV